MLAFQCGCSSSSPQTVSLTSRPSLLRNRCYTEPMQLDLKEFYSWVVHTRKALFAFLRTVPADVYERPDSSGKSLLQQQRHVINTYRWWTGSVLLGRPWTAFGAESLPQIEAGFADVDAMVYEALSSTALPQSVRHTNDAGVTENLDARWLVLHPITHEFHHKGQLVMMARLLGYTFPEGHDSDLQFLPNVSQR